MKLIQDGCTCSRRKTGSAALRNTTDAVQTPHQHALSGASDEVCEQGEELARRWMGASRRSRPEAKPTPTPKSLKLTLTSSLPRSVTGTLGQHTLALVGSFLIDAKLTASTPETRGRRGRGI